MITGLDEQQLKALVYLRNTHEYSYTQIISVLSELIGQEVESLKNSSETISIYRAQGAINILEEFKTLLSDPNTALARLTDKR